MGWIGAILTSILVAGIGFIVSLILGFVMVSFDNSPCWAKEFFSGLIVVIMGFLGAFISIIVLWVLKLAFGMALWLAILLSPVLSAVLSVIILLIFYLFNC